MDKLSKADTPVFDKTITLRKGKTEVSGIKRGQQGISQYLLSQAAVW
ncbi:hypothetical protein [Heyndrickxia acidiproducens]|jgi:hypothetical protein|nr:hypothetical protein [Heyndrickxia acidiproducens]